MKEEEKKREKMRQKQQNWQTINRIDNKDGKCKKRLRL
jgi:hypothetical protein